MGLEGAFTGALANRPLPALAAHHRFMGEFCCTAISLLLLRSVPAPGEWPALLDLSPCPDPGRPQSTDVCEIPHGMRIGLRRFQDLGEAVSSRRNRSGTGTKGYHGDHARETVPHTKYTLSHAMPAQWGHGTMCGAAGLGRCRTGH